MQKNKGSKVVKWILIAVSVVLTVKKGVLRNFIEVIKEIKDKHPDLSDS